jgi:cytochrome c peroxidase
MMTVLQRLASISIISLMAVGCAQQSMRFPHAPHTEAIFKTYSSKLLALDSSMSDWIRSIQQLEHSASFSDSIHCRFEIARRAYKRLEWIVEATSPGSAKQLNGAALDEAEETDQKIISPSGFQVVEAIIFPKADVADAEKLIDELKRIQSATRRMRVMLDGIAFTDALLFDALRQELFRVITLGISGYDSPIAQRSVSEAAEALRGVEEGLGFFATDLSSKQPTQFRALSEKLTAAIQYVERSQASFNDFDRAEFITRYINPLCEALYDMQTAAGIAFVDYRRPLSTRAKTLFDVDAFVLKGYAPFYVPNSTPDLVQLGKLLFHDPILSENNQRACASCHQPEKAFQDGRPRAVALGKDNAVLRNTPTLINAALQPSSSYDQSTVYLEDRVEKVLQSPSEMHSSLKLVAEKLMKSDGYIALFQKAFSVKQAGISTTEPITPEQVKQAIGAYVRTLVSLNSRFDKYMRGDTAQISAEEKHGFNLFMGKAKCGTCHFMPLFNGTVPPTYIGMEAEVIGVPKEPKWTNAEIDPDTGKQAVTHMELHRYAFKTTTVRNAELTAPYMHNGVYKTLDDVMRFYNMGGGKGIGIDLPNQTLPFDSLALSQSEIRALISFVKTLTDTTGLTVTPTTLPSFNLEAWQRRKIGGAY